ncbi:MAG: hypothetical protein HUJ55_04085 [Ileibacterium sp.]|nr:hypothetical protein [Ileibacterium sp.]
MFDTTDLQQYNALEPVVFENSQILFLVSMPSVDSENENFYFADSDNRFWPTLSAIYGMPCSTKEECLAILEQNNLAIWSVVKSCLRHLSRENTMQDIVLNDISGFLAQYPNIQRIICVSRDTEVLLKEADYNAANMAVYVPSPSAADLWYDSVEKLVPEYEKALNLE